jgi:putative ABC transport system permease protein
MTGPSDACPTVGADPAPRPGAGGDAPARGWERVDVLLAGSRTSLVLAWRNLMHDRARFAVAIVGIAFASFLIAVQGGLLYGFTMAASRIIDAVDADIWMVAKGIPSLDFVSGIPERYRDLAKGTPGVAWAGRGASTWVPYQRPDGRRSMVFAIGIDAPFLGAIPDPRVAAIQARRAEQGLVVDITDAQPLGIPARLGPQSTEVEIAGRRGRIVHVTQGLSSFLGTPIVVARYGDAKDYLPLGQEQSSFLLARVAPGERPEAVRDRLRARFVDLDVWTRHDFSWRSRTYWLVQTGAGGALTLAAVLGFLIGLVVVSQTIYAVTVEYLEEFATLRAMGASDGFVRRIVLVQSLICGLLGLTAGLVAVEPFAGLARSVVTWALVPWWMYPAVLAVVLLLCLLAALVAARPALRVDPGKVFRA